MHVVYRNWVLACGCFRQSAFVERPGNESMSACVISWNKTRQTHPSECRGKRSAHAEVGLFRKMQCPHQSSHAGLFIVLVAVLG